MVLYYTVIVLRHRYMYNTFLSPHENQLIFPNTDTQIEQQNNKVP